MSTRLAPTRESAGRSSALLREVPLATRSFGELRGELAPAAWERLEAAVEDARAALAGRTVWAVNSTERGGGVAEMMRTLLPYSRAPAWMFAGWCSTARRSSSG